LPTGHVAELADQTARRLAARATRDLLLTPAGVANAQGSPHRPDDSFHEAPAPVD
jgi:hypothetical protein